jgi:hypothetical protein
MDTTSGEFDSHTTSVLHAARRLPQPVRPLNIAWT